MQIYIVIKYIYCHIYDICRYNFPPTTQESKTPKTTLSDAGDDKPPLKHSSFCYSLKIPLLLFPQIIIIKIIIIISPVTWNLLRFPHGIYYIISVVGWLEQLDNPKQNRCHRPITTAAIHIYSCLLEATTAQTNSKTSPKLCAFLRLFSSQEKYDATIFPVSYQHRDPIENKLQWKTRNQNKSGKKQANQRNSDPKKPRHVTLLVYPLGLV